MSFSIRTEYKALSDRVAILDANTPSDQSVHRVSISTTGKNSYNLNISAPGLITPEGIICCSGILEIFLRIKVINDDANLDELYRINIFYDDSEPPSTNYFGVVESNIVKSIDWISIRQVAEGNTLNIIIDNILSSNFTISDETSIILRFFPGNSDVNEIIVN